MCGIVGFVSGGHSGKERGLAIAREMTTALAHRGPDAHGCWSDPTSRVFLGHRRLSVIDLSAGGAQPMVSTDGRGVLVYNGEIYNFTDLRAELESEGIGFRSRSDTEVLLAALHHWGPERTLPKLNGMFAFAYWDGRRGALFLGRDRIGEKPLYYSVHRGVLIFGSELKALRAHPDFPAAINQAALSLYVRYNYVPAPYCIYEHARKLPAAHWIRFDPADIRPAEPMPYWSMESMVSGAIAKRRTESSDDLVSETDRLLRKSVQARTVSDRSLGCFLSGGIDSSTIAAVMQQVSSRRIQTFTIGYGEAELNEARHAEAVARHLGTDHTTFVVRSGDALEIIPQLADIYDEPFADSSQIPTCLLSRLTARHVTVALTGDGGDEAFGGYNRYVWAGPLWRRLRGLSPALRAGVLALLNGLSPERWDAAFGALGLVLPKRRRVRSPGDKLHKIAFLGGARDERELYRRLTSLSDDPGRTCPGPSGVLLPFETRATPSGLDSLEERMMFWDSVTYLPDDILVKVDRAAMRYGLEGRIPFLDNDLLQFAWQLPLAEKVGKAGGKLILRKVLEHYVPREIFDRPKAGFAIPIGVWLRGPLRDWAEQLLRSPDLEAHVKMEPVRELWQQHLSGRRNQEHQLWSILMLGAWLERWGRATPVVPCRPGTETIGLLTATTAVDKRRAGRGRVIFLLNSLEGAGAEKQVILSAFALARSGFGAEIYTLTSGEHGARNESLLRSATAAGVFVYRPPTGRRWLTSVLSACRQSLRRDAACVLWTWGYRADLAAVTCLRGLAPRISSLRSANAKQMRQRAFWWRRFDGTCARYVSNTWLNVEQLAGILPGVEGRCRVLYNALEHEALGAEPVSLPDQPDRLEIVMMGNVRIEVKGYDLAIEMLRRLRGAGRSVRLRIAGLPVERAALERRIQEAGLGGDCVFVGPVSEPLQFLRTGHVFLLFSRLEGMPNALLEAMALGLPCISTKVGDVARFTTDRVHLRQIEIGDVSGACEAVQDALENWAEFRAMGAAARRLIAEKFSLQSFEHDVVACVDDLIPVRAGELPRAGTTHAAATQPHA